MREGIRTRSKSTRSSYRHVLPWSDVIDREPRSNKTVPFLPPTSTGTRSLRTHPPSRSLAS